MKKEDKELLVKALTDHKLVSERLKRDLLQKLTELQVHGEAATHDESETPALIQMIETIYTSAGAKGLAIFCLIMLDVLTDFVLKNNQYIVDILDIQSDEAPEF